MPTPQLIIITETNETLHHTPGTTTIHHGAIHTGRHHNGIHKYTTKHRVGHHQHGYTWLPTPPVIRNPDSTKPIPS